MHKSSHSETLETKYFLNDGWYSFLNMDDNVAQKKELGWALKQHL